MNQEKKKKKKKPGLKHGRENPKSSVPFMHTVRQAYLADLHMVEEKMGNANHGRPLDGYLSRGRRCTFFFSNAPTVGCPSILLESCGPYL